MRQGPRRKVDFHDLTFSAVPLIFHA